MATFLLFSLSLGCTVCAFLSMFISFTSPFWYKSWTRVHSQFSNIGLWHICLAGYIKPQDPTLKSYVGCWWIHSSEFDSVRTFIMPSWFMGIQALSIFTFLATLAALIILILYIPTVTFNRVFKGRQVKMQFILAIILLASAFLVFIIALVFAEMCNDPNWMPRPWMNYLSWGYGMCVLSGFFAAFAGMFVFLRGLILKDIELGGKDIDEKIKLEKHVAERARAKEMEAMREQAPSEDYRSGKFEEMSMQRDAYGPPPTDLRPPYKPDVHQGRQFDYVPQQRGYVYPQRDYMPAPRGFRTGSETYSGYHSGSESSAIPSAAPSTKAESVV
ncbi:uncharacterized protein LOC121377309 [Gigantopelta aegis]|uniref:uncharacterized protein LOC121377309 n=1 Tax=Gigantopelta aegis TaxID=1735272 RepID=UPI001B88CF0F|nr:uncharacterized protein LOC121377309 [Gigantopelta aegis]